jgi:hypothetical protein
LQQIFSYGAILSETKVYNLYISGLFKLILFGGLAIFVIIGLLIASGFFLAADPNGPPRVFGLVVLLIVGWNAFWLLSFPHRIVVSPTGEVQFISLIRRRATSLSDIKSIKPERGQFGFLMVRTSQRRIMILNQFDGFHDFILLLKSRNPSVEIRGC